MKHIRHFRNRLRESGTVAVVAAVSILGLMGFTGMAVDVGYLQWTQVRIQDAADAAAQAALLELENGQSDFVSVGKAAASMNGFTDGSNGVTVTINNPPTRGTMVGETNAVEALVKQSTGTYFMGTFGFKNVTVGGRAAGAYTSSTGAGSGTGSGCVYVLDSASADSQTLNVQGSSPTFNCGVVVESPNANAVYLSGALVVTMGTGYTLGVVGPSSCTAASPATQTNCGIDYTSNQSYICSTGQSSCSATSNPKEPTSNGITSPGDPLSSIAVPSFGTTFSTKNYYDSNSAPTGNTLQPGIYCGGLTIGNTNGATYTLSAGTYIIAGGTVQFNSSGTIIGNGVTFYLTSPADVTTTTGTACSSSLVSPTSTTMATVNINGQPNVTLSAPVSGATHGVVGMLFFENRSSTTDNAPQIVGNSTTSLNGAMYFKNSTLTFSGVNGSTTGYIMIVVKKLNINGSSPIVVYYVGNPISTSAGSGTTGTGAVLAE